jgi:hypothetical protein
LGGGGGGGGGGGAAKPTAASATKVTSAGLAKGIAIAAVGVGALATLWEVVTTPGANDAPMRSAVTGSATPTTSADPNAAPDEPNPAADPSTLPVTLGMPSFLPATAPSPHVHAIPRTDSGALSPEVQKEVELLKKATLAMPEKPTEALAICDRAAAAYPNGVLGQEREVIAIRALVSLDRTDEARARAQTFRAKYPNSAQTQRIDQILSAH